MCACSECHLFVGNPSCIWWKEGGLNKVNLCRFGNWNRQEGRRADNWISAKEVPNPQVINDRHNKEWKKSNINSSTYKSRPHYNCCHTLTVLTVQLLSTYYYGILVLWFVCDCYIWSYWILHKLESLIVLISWRLPWKKRLMCPEAKLRKTRLKFSSWNNSYLA